MSISSSGSTLGSSGFKPVGSENASSLSTFISSTSLPSSGPLSSFSSFCLLDSSASNSPASSVAATSSSLALSSLPLGSLSLTDGPVSYFSFFSGFSSFSSSLFSPSFSSTILLSSPVSPMAESSSGSSFSSLFSSSVSSSLTLNASALKSCSISMPLSFLLGTSFNASCSSPPCSSKHYN
ncbi:hypothetical protein HanIR_Chr09g0449651 [Helianthus annuus]|nr:hypothetical protein HanIR_Chr09g0449651 [Helianthus annuus]